LEARRAPEGGDLPGDLPGRAWAASALPKVRRGVWRAGGLEGGSPPSESEKQYSIPANYVSRPGQLIKSQRQQ
jgi:hypothetical protein